MPGPKGKDVDWDAGIKPRQMNEKLLTVPRYDIFNLTGTHPAHITGGNDLFARLRQVGLKFHEDKLTVQTPGSLHAAIQQLSWPSYDTYVDALALVNQCGTHEQQRTFVFEYFKKMIQPFTNSTFNPRVLLDRPVDAAAYTQPAPSYFLNTPPPSLHNCFTHPKNMEVQSCRHAAGNPLGFLDEKLLLVGAYDVTMGQLYPNFKAYTTVAQAQEMRTCFCVGPQHLRHRTPALGNVAPLAAHPVFVGGGPPPPRASANPKATTNRGSSSPISIDSDSNGDDHSPTPASKPPRRPKPSYEASGPPPRKPDLYTPRDRSTPDEKQAHRAGPMSGGRKPSVMNELQKLDSSGAARDKQKAEEDKKRMSSGDGDGMPKKKGKSGNGVEVWIGKEGAWKRGLSARPRAPPSLDLDLGEVMDYDRLMSRHPATRDIYNPRDGDTTGGPGIVIGVWKNSKGAKKNRVQAHLAEGKTNPYLRYNASSKGLDGRNVAGGCQVKFKDIELLGPWAGGSADWVNFQAGELLFAQVGSAESQQSSDNDIEITGSNARHGKKG